MLILLNARRISAPHLLRVWGSEATHREIILEGGEDSRVLPVESNKEGGKGGTHWRLHPCLPRSIRKRRTEKKRGLVTI